MSAPAPRKTLGRFAGRAILVTEAPRVWVRQQYGASPSPADWSTRPLATRTDWPR